MNKKVSVTIYSSRKPVAGKVGEITEFVGESAKIVCEMTVESHDRPRIIP